ncbi:MAG: helix-turn-helix domain-containing protein [Methanobrevibacter sp.]|jgi:transposase|nr:helix-turn-helix domain-containing protein [Candidatus Methanovirga aequatorialis]
MAGKSKIKIEDHLTMEEINELIKDLKIEVNLYKRLLFLKSVKKGVPISHAAEFVGINRGTGFRWIKQYNENGLDGLMPKYGGGRPSFLSDEQLKELKKILSDPKENYSIHKTQLLIKEKFKVEYSYKQVWEIVRKKLRLNYSKPFPVYENKPKRR